MHHNAKYDLDMRISLECLGAPLWRDSQPVDERDFGKSVVVVCPGDGKTHFGAADTKPRSVLGESSS